MCVCVCVSCFVIFLAELFTFDIVTKPVWMSLKLEVHVGSAVSVRVRGGLNSHLHVLTQSPLCLLVEWPFSLTTFSLT